jgi:hypothetical protein
MNESASWQQNIEKKLTQMVCVTTNNQLKG